jgi:hypothetical protein
MNQLPTAMLETRSDAKFAFHVFAVARESDATLNSPAYILLFNSLASNVNRPELTAVSSHGNIIATGERTESFAVT